MLDRKSPVLEQKFLFKSRFLISGVQSNTSNKAPSSNSSSQKTQRELKLGKKDIAKIIGTLEKLDEDAKKATMILQKNSSQASSKISSSGKDSNTADVIDNLMKSTKSALEEVELPSESRRDHQTGMCNFFKFFPTTC